MKKVTLVLVCLIASACGRHDAQRVDDNRAVHCAYLSPPIGDCAVTVQYDRLTSPHCSTVEIDLGVGNVPALIHNYSGTYSLHDSIDFKVGKCVLYLDKLHPLSATADSRATSIRPQ
jgi:hypothetical protein